MQPFSLNKTVLAGKKAPKREYFTLKKKSWQDSDLTSFFLMLF